MVLVLAAALLALAVAAPAAREGAVPPEPTPRPAPTPEVPAGYAGLRAELLAAIDAWTDRRTHPPPPTVRRLAAEQQRLVVRLARRPGARRRALAGLRGRARAELRDLVTARRELASIHSVVVQRPRIRLGRPQPAERLRSHYRRAWRRFGVGWPLLAAVNFVESRFGRYRNQSVSGARGPMQFMPATWRAYGMGGNVRDPRDAILGAANYLRAGGAPRSEARALYRYNPSHAYVRAVRRYTRLFRADERLFYALYSWEVLRRR